VSHKPGGRLPLLSARPAVTLATLRGLLPISLLGEQRHDGLVQVTHTRLAGVTTVATHAAQIHKLKCRHGKAPQYLVDRCTPVIDVVGRQRLRSATQQLIVVPRHRLTTVGRRAFAVHGSMVWNSLPDDLRAQQDYESFRQGLKTWLFSRYWRVQCIRDFRD